MQLPQADAVSARVNAERIVLLGWSRAILLQLAHPLVAAGVAEHSSFRGGPLAAASRLRHTVRAMLALTFGTVASRDRAIEGIKTIHRRVNGRLPSATGTFPSGTPYSAEDPALLLWVHATLLESIPLVYEQLVKPLTAAERDAYCDQAAGVALALGARDAEIPRTWAALERYLEGKYASGEIVVGAQARALAAAVLAPPLAPFIAPLTWVNRLLSVGLLPGHMRMQYGFAWSEADQRHLQRVGAGIRGLRGFAPVALALWPEARRRAP